MNSTETRNYQFDKKHNDCREMRHALQEHFSHCYEATLFMSKLTETTIDDCKCKVSAVHEKYLAQKIVICLIFSDDDITRDEFFNADETDTCTDISSVILDNYEDDDLTTFDIDFRQLY